MKKLLILFFTCLTISVEATTVWWIHSFSENAVVHSKDGTFSITEYAENVLGDSLYNVAYMVKDVTSGTYLDFWFDGFDSDSVNWVEGSGDGYPYMRYQQVSTGADVKFTLVETEDGIKEVPIEDWTSFSRDWSDELIVELHLYDENIESFMRFAVSDIFTLEDIKKDLYGQGSVAPPRGATEFVDFYTDDYVPIVPEPSSVFFFLLGTCIILLRRKNYDKQCF